MTTGQVAEFRTAIGAPAGTDDFLTTRTVGQPAIAGTTG